MKVIVLCALFALAFARPQNPADGQAEVRRLENDVDINRYKYGFETSNGITADESGELVNEGAENESIVVRGQYSFVGLDGVTYTVTYIADENGFQPQGAHLPKN